MRTAPLFLALLLFGGYACGTSNQKLETSVSASSAVPAREGLELPTAENTEPMVGDAPVVIVDKKKISVDGQPAGAIPSLDQPRRADELYNVLKRKREAWKEAHPDEPFAGVAVIHIDRNESALVAKTVFQTAAYAGFPNLSFAVRPTRGDGVQRINVNAQIPGPPDPREQPSPPKLSLHVYLTPTELKLLWRRGNEVAAESKVARASGYAALADQVRSGWEQRGTHKDASDWNLDDAIVYVANDTPFQDVVSIIEALQSTKRNLMVQGEARRIPAFDVMFSVKGPDSAPDVQGN